MQTLTAPSSTWAESVTLFDWSTDVLGLRNLLSELGHLQVDPTVIFQDNKSAILLERLSRPTNWSTGLKFYLDIRTGSQMHFFIFVIFLFC
jgi:hypothetical protein